MRHESSVVVNRPINEVWAFLADPFNMPRWRGSRLAVRVTSPGPVGVGSSIQQRMVIFGFETVIRTVVTEWDPPRTITHSVMNAGMVRLASFRLTLKATAGGTKVVRVLEAEPRPAFKPLFWIAGSFVRRQMDAQTQNLKGLLESGRA